MNKIHENIKRLRTEHNLTQEEVAEKLYVTRQCISRWEQGITVPDLESMEKLAKVFEVSINDIFEENAVKELAIDNAKANQIFKKLLIALTSVTLLGLLTLGIFVFLRPTNSNASQLDMTPRSINAKIESRDLTENTITVQASNMNTNEDSIEVTLDFGPIQNKVYQYDGRKIDSSKLSTGDIIIIEYAVELNSKWITKVILVDDKVERDFLGVIVVTNGKTYQSYDDVIENRNDKGLIFHLNQATYDTFGYKSNTVHNRFASEFSYEMYGDQVIYTHTDYQFTVFYNQSLLIHPIKIGIVYEDGIEYVTKTYNKYEYNGEIDYDNENAPLLYHSHEFTYTLYFEEVSSITEIDVFEYDQNNQLIESTNINNILNMNNFTINPDAIYSFVKVKSISILGNPVFHVYELLAGESVELNIADEFGLIRSEKFYYN